MRRIVILCVMAVFALSAVAQQTAKVSLSLIDSATKEGIMGAVIELYPTSKPDNKKYYTFERVIKCQIQ